MIYVSIISLVVLLIITRLIFKEFLIPPIVMQITWMISLTVLLYTNFDYNINSFVYLIFLMGIFLFTFGYLLGANGLKTLRNTFKYYESNYIFKINFFLVKSMIFIEMLLIVFTLIFYIRSSKLYNFSNFYITLKFIKDSNTDKEFEIFFNIFKYFGTLYISFTLYILYFYLFIDGKKTRKTKKIVILQIILGLFIVILSLGRTSVLLYILSIFMLYYFNNQNFNNQKRGLFIVKLVILGIIWIMFFFIFNFIKYPYRFHEGNFLSQNLKITTGYISGSIVAFDKWLIKNEKLLFGKNIFRFFFAIIYKMGFKIETPNLVQQFTYIGDNEFSNVYTFFYYYVKDFGILYSVMIEFFLGFVNGFIYKLNKERKGYWTYLYVLSFYPALMQFFQDQYFSLMSMWLQYILWGFIFFKSNLFIKVVKHK